MWAGAFIQMTVHKSWDCAMSTSCPVSSHVVCPLSTHGSVLRLTFPGGGVGLFKHSEVSDIHKKPVNKFLSSKLPNLLIKASQPHNPYNYQSPIPGAELMHLPTPALLPVPLLSPAQARPLGFVTTHLAPAIVFLLLLDACEKSRGRLILRTFC